MFHKFEHADVSVGFNMEVVGVQEGGDAIDHYLLVLTVVNHVLQSDVIIFQIIFENSSAVDSFHLGALDVLEEQNN